MNLDEAIRKFFEDEIFDPATIAQAIQKRYDDKWLAHELLSISDEILTSRVRSLLTHVRGDYRRITESGPSTRMSPERVTAAERYGRHIWVPKGVGYKPIVDCSAADLRAAAGYLRGLAETHSRNADELESLAVDVETAGVSTVRELPARAKPLTMPRVEAPARVKVEPESNRRPPARSKKAAVA